MTPIEFRRLQSKIGLGNKELAELLQVHVNTITSWKSGVRTISDRMEKYITMITEEYKKNGK